MVSGGSEAKTTRPANKRGAARLAAVQALYQMELTHSGIAEIAREYENLRLGHEIDGEQYIEADIAWFHGVLSGVVSNQKKIDPIIHGALTPDWPLSRIDILLRAILRSAVYELLERKNVPARVVINEYVDVAHAFYSGDEPKMVNGVLDRIARKARSNELPARPSGETEN
jgi:transcription antitermination protein NusB